MFEQECHLHELCATEDIINVEEKYAMNK